MCGLVAILSTGAPLPPDAITRAAARLSHRGPDGEGFWTSPDGRVALGHRRLSIVDLATGGQPLFNEAGDIVAVVTGELYGFEAIRRELEVEGHRFRTRSDSEILLHLYEKHGVDCVHRLRGEFAFVLWDERRRTLFAARDRFGIKPLFFAVMGDALCIASEAKALFAMGVAPAWDADSFYQHLFVCMDEDRTLFQGVSQVPGGHALIAAPEGRRVVRYWDLDYPRAHEIPPYAEEASIARLRDALDAAVRTRMRADVPVGCMLSGGIDSSTVLALASRSAPDGVKAFTVVFDHPTYDEGPAAREMAEHVGASFQACLFTNDALVESFSDAAWHGETICFNGHALSRYLLSRAIHEAGVKTVVVGEGGDELFAGYLFSRQDMLEASGGDAQGQPGAGQKPPDPSLAAVKDLLGSVPNVFKGFAESRAVFRELLAPDFARRQGQQSPFVTLLSRLDLRGQVEGRHPMLQGLYIWSKSLLPNYVLAAERLDMAHAVEVRQPLLDHDLFELVRQLPPSALVRDLIEKYALREAARPWLPERIYRAEKHPFTAPPATLSMKGPFYAFLQDKLRSRAMASVPFINHRAVAALLDALPRMSAGQRIRLDSVLLMLCSVCVLQERFIQRKAAPE